MHSCIKHVSYHRSIRRIDMLLFDCRMLCPLDTAKNSVPLDLVELYPSSDVSRWLILSYMMDLMMQIPNIESNKTLHFLLRIFCMI